MEIDELHAFHAIYRHLSVTKASVELNISKTSLSKKLDSLEHKLDGKLFSRTTRKIVPTEKGISIFKDVDELLKKIEKLKHSSVSKTKIKISCNHSMSLSFLGEAIFSYQKDNPDVIIELLVSDHVIDLLEDSVDFTIRVNPSKNSNLIGKKVGQYKLHAVVRKEYGKKIPKNLSELSKEPLIFIDKHFAYLKKNKLKNISKNRFFKTNDSTLVSKIIRSSDTIGIRSSWDLEDLKIILPETSISDGEIWLLRSPSIEHSVIHKEFGLFLEKFLKLKFS